MSQFLLVKIGLTQVSWQVSWPEFGRALAAGKDLHSPLFSPLPVDDSQPQLRAIIATGKDKIGVKKVSWKSTKGNEALMAGMFVWREDGSGAGQVAPLRRLAGQVNEMLDKKISFEDFLAKVW